MKTEIDFKGQITTKKAIKMLKKEGMKVTIEEAEQILVFLRKIANIAVSKYLKDSESKNKGINTNQKNKGKAINKTVVNYCKPCIITNADLKT